MPLRFGAPKLPKTDNQSECYNTSFTHGPNPIFMSPGMGNSVASSADIALYRKRREAMIARGEDPDAAAKAHAAKHEARKERMKGLFGIESKSLKGLPSGYHPSREGEVVQDDGLQKECLQEESQETDLQEKHLSGLEERPMDEDVQKKGLPEEGL